MCAPWRCRPRSTPTCGSTTGTYRMASSGNRAIEIESTKYWDYDDAPDVACSEPVFDPPAHPRAPSGTPSGLTEAVADGADGLDQVGVLLAELGAQAADMDVDGASAAVVLVAPHA